MVGVQVGAAGHARRKRALQARVALDEAPHVVAEHAVPLGPDVPVGERSDLVHAEVPGLGDEVNLGQHGVLGNVADERRRRQRRALAVCCRCGWGGLVGCFVCVSQRIWVSLLPLSLHARARPASARAPPQPREPQTHAHTQRTAAEAGREVEAEAVDVVLLHPVEQRGEDEVAHDRVVGAHRVAAPAVVEQLHARACVCVFGGGAGQGGVLVWAGVLGAGRRRGDDERVEGGPKRRRKTTTHPSTHTPTHTHTNNNTLPTPIHTPRTCTYAAVSTM